MCSVVIYLLNAKVCVTLYGNMRRAVLSRVVTYLVKARATATANNGKAVLSTVPTYLVNVKDLSHPLW